MIPLHALATLNKLLRYVALIFYFKLYAKCMHAHTALPAKQLYIYVSKYSTYFIVNEL